MDSISHFHNTISHTTCALVSTVNLYIKFWRRWREWFVLWKLIFCLDWFYFSTSYFIPKKKKEYLVWLFLSLLKFLEFWSLLKRLSTTYLHLSALPHLCSFAIAHKRTLDKQFHSALVQSIAPLLRSSALADRYIRSDTDQRSSSVLKHSSAVHSYDQSHLYCDQAH